MFSAEEDALNAIHGDLGAYAHKAPFRGPKVTREVANIAEGSKLHSRSKVMEPPQSASEPHVVLLASRSMG